MTIAAKDVMALRQKTGLGMMDCKRALKETDGDITAAEEYLRQQKKGKMDSRTERTTGEGRIGIAISGDKAVIVEVRTETDFTARNEAFVEMVDKVTSEAMGLPAGDIDATQGMTEAIDNIRITTGENANFARGQRLDGGSFGQYVHHDGKRAALVQIEGDVDGDLLKGICQHIVFHDPRGVSEADVATEELDKIRAEATAEATESGKPAEIVEKIAEGRVRKFLQENTLLAQKFVLDETKTVSELLPSGATIKRFIRYTLGS